ncbi:MAG: alpha-D-glucose phosphate-specific phosphoglucomutase, partial [Bryobacteraceae bacterium]
HILAITQAICDHRKQQSVDGPLFLGIDTHALSESALASALEVLAANDVSVMLDDRDGYTPTPVISHAILTHNRGRRTGLADGIVITPSHNPPEDGGFKYNPPNGGPAETEITTFIQNRANMLLENGLAGVRRTISRCSKPHDYISEYVRDLGTVVDMDLIRNGRIKIGVDPMGGAGVHYWGPIAERYGVDLTVVNQTVDKTFRFMMPDWDGKIRMDPSSILVMQGLVAVKDKFDVAFACDTDHDRHGVVCRSSGLLPSNDYLSVCIHYLFRERTGWSPDAAAGKTVVSSAMIDRVAARLGRRVYEVPVGFKWFVDGLLDGSLGFTGEESAGSSFLARDGSPWSTDKDGMIAGLLAAELMARLGKDPGEVYQELCRDNGRPFYARIDAPATAAQRAALGKMTPADMGASRLGGEKIETILAAAPGNQRPIGGIKVIAKSGWFAARPSGTEDIYKIYAESFRDRQHLAQIQQEAQAMVDEQIGAPAAQRMDR